MPGRTQALNVNGYKYSHNGQLKDNEVFEGALSAEFWEYDSRIGRRWEIDPLVYEWQSSYACFNNNPIYFADPTGLEGEPSGGDDKGKSDGGKDGAKDKGKQEKERQAHADARNKYLEGSGWECVYENGQIIERRKGGGTQSPDAKTNPDNSTGNNTPPTSESKTKESTPASDPVAVNKSNNGGGGLNNIVLIKKQNISGGSTTGKINDLATKIAFPLGAAEWRASKVLEKVGFKGKPFLQSFGNSFKLGKYNFTKPNFQYGNGIQTTYVRRGFSLGITVPTKAIKITANVLKHAGRVLGGLGLGLTAAQYLNGDIGGGEAFTDALFGAIGFFGPVGFGVSSLYSFVVKPLFLKDYFRKPDEIKIQTK